MTPEQRNARDAARLVERRIAADVIAQILTYEPQKALKELQCYLANLTEMNAEAEDLLRRALRTAS
jgi:hypothetical protein